MDHLVYFLAYLAVYALIIIGVTPWLRSSLRARNLFSIGWGLYLAVQITFFQTRMPVRFGEEISSLGWGGNWIEKVHGSRSDARRFVDSSCTLIDVSYDQELVPHPELGDSTLRRAITDREKLTRLLQHLDSNQQLFDVVALDIYFQDATDSDTALAAALGALTAKGKLVLAYDPLLCTNRTIYEHPGIAPAFGGITEERVEDLYFQHTLIAPRMGGQVAFSMPYRIYAQLDSIGAVEHVNHWLGYAHETGRKGNAWFSVRHTPLFLLGPPKEDFVDEGLHGWTGGDDAVHQLHDGAVTSTGPWPRTLLLGSLVSPGSMRFFDAELALHRRVSKKHMVFIGNFNDEGSDVHETVSGAMHGALMQVNIVHELLNGQHHGIWLLFFLLWAVFAVFVWLLIERCMRPAHEHRQRSRAVVDFLARAWHHLFREARHYWMLLGLLLLVEFLFHRAVNVMSVGLLFGIMEMILRSWLPVRKRA